ncbi:MAG: response regulator, partial [Alphaproteobacteria bacterium]|nr:response regulator [Alphaproteobacteria bacterium]
MSEMPKINYSNMTAMIIDDQEFVREIISKMLYQFGFEKVLTAADGGAGFDALESNKPDVIICDIAMKPVGGLEFVQKLREHPMAAYAYIPVIIMTGDMNADVMIKAKKLGISAAVIKPVPPKKLREKIDSLFNA